LLLVAGALLLLRLFPLAVEAGLRLAARARGAVGLLAFAQVARNPAGPSRLMLLLALSVGLGVFALTFDASLARNAADRAAYQAGADLRLVQLGAEPPVVDARLEGRLAALPGVRGLTPVDRSVAFDLSIANGVGVLAIDPVSWGWVAGATSWRSSYADQPLATLVAGLRDHQWGADAPDRAGDTAADDPSHPVWALLDETFAATQHMRVGEAFSLSCSGTFTACAFRVGAIVRDFPTLYPAQEPDGFIVADLSDYLGAIASATQSSSSENGPNEYWLKTSDDPAQRAALAQVLDGQGVHADASLDVDHAVDRRALEAAIAGNPVQAGMRGLLLLGALAAAALAVLGSLAQSVLAARQRGTQFAALRTLGLGGRELVRLLLGEQLVVNLFGLLGGTLVALVLATATLPFLEFSDTLSDPTTDSVPPYLLGVDPLRLALFYAALLIAFALALASVAGYAVRLGLARALRLDED
jgi:putative ABC transport system permease protein